ncbi:MAG: hypothetical protein JWO44_1515 [Bacteroidetes bacterium]|nr:hypothetical protein [Bacteroidota bacterium]
MKKALLFLFSFISIFASAQDSTDSHHGSVKVQKKGTLHSVLYDDVNFRLVGRDIYGNINDTAVVSFDLDVTIKGLAYSEQAAGCFISKQMQQRLSRMDGVIVLRFSNIKAKDRNGKIISFPDFKAQSGKAREGDNY